MRSPSASIGGLPGRGPVPGRRALRAAEHLPDMLRFRGHAEATDLVHYMWLPMPSLDRRLLPPKRARVFTMHWRLPRRAPGSAAP